MLEGDLAVIETRDRLRRGRAHNDIAMGLAYHIRIVPVVGVRIPEPLVGRLRVGVDRRRLRGVARAHFHQVGAVPVLAAHGDPLRHAIDTRAAGGEVGLSGHRQGDLERVAVQQVHEGYLLQLHDADAAHESRRPRPSRHVWHYRFKNPPRVRPACLALGRLDRGRHFRLRGLVHHGLIGSSMVSSTGGIIGSSIMAPLSSLEHPASIIARNAAAMTAIATLYPLRFTLEPSSERVIRYLRGPQREDLERWNVHPA